MAETPRTFGSMLFPFVVTVLSILTYVTPAGCEAAHRAMVVSESAPASEVGLAILKQGGNAIDAATATALAVGVTNPASCGIGGGGFMLIYLAKEGKFYALDYRETAPHAASADMYYRDGKPNEELAKVGPLAVAVPGEIAGIDAALKRFGTMKFQQVAAPAVKLARDGFPVSEHLAGEIKSGASMLAMDPGLKEVFLKPDGSAPAAGEKIYEKKLADTIEHLGNTPVAKFYDGPIGKELVSYLGDHGGIVTADDLADYQPIWRDPLHRAYNGMVVYAMPPPSSGGVVLEMLGMLEPGHLAGLGLNSPPYLARLIEVMRQGFDDRSLYADPVFVHVPLDVLLSPSHINEARDRALHQKDPAAMAAEAHDHGTSNLCVVDEAGNVVDITTTINTVFGAKMTVPKLGVILNDEMDDFSVAPGVANAYKLVGTDANSIAPGKRPLSSMTPVIVVKQDKPVLTAGGSGGPTIISGVLQVALDVLDFHCSAEDAVANPRLHEQANPDVVVIEEKMPQTSREALAQMHYHLRVIPALGAVNAITIAPGNLHGAFDPRKGGGAAGY
ncbi:MAG TPA: gamma-glutamyltransferase [Candidatus Binataceae bacterium]|nr:gamma-glutamyltransferase [Candidatus Binataceae bacterium]